MRSMAAFISTTLRCNCYVIGLGPGGVDFPEHFLADELQLAPLRRIAIEQSQELFGMTSQAGDFFVNIAAIRKQCDFTNDVIFTERDRCVGQSIDEHAPGFCLGTQRQPVEPVRPHVSLLFR